MLGCGLGPENERHSHPAPGKQLDPSECQFSHLKKRKQVKSRTHNWCRIYSKQSAGVSYSAHHAVHEGEASLGYRCLTDAFQGRTKKDSICLQSD